MISARRLAGMVRALAALGYVAGATASSEKWGEGKMMSAATAGAFFMAAAGGDPSVYWELPEHDRAPGLWLLRAAGVTDPALDRAPVAQVKECFDAFRHGFRQGALEEAHRLAADVLHVIDWEYSRSRVVLGEGVASASTWAEQLRREAESFAAQEYPGRGAPVAVEEGVDVPLVVVVRDPDASNEYVTFGTAMHYDIDAGRADLSDPAEFAEWAAGHREYADRLELVDGHHAAAAFIREVVGRYKTVEFGGRVAVEQAARVRIDIEACRRVETILRDRGEVDAAGEVYALGCLLGADVGPLAVSAPGGQHTDEFQRYIDQGFDAARTHPDFDELDPWQTAKDVIGNVLHWAEDVLAAPDDEPFSPEALLESALIGYRGDFEDDRP